MTAALRHEIDIHGPLVAETETSTARRPVVLVVTAVVLVGLTLMVAAFLQSQLVVGQHRVQELEQARMEQESLLENDRVELMIARAPHTVAQEAERLGMIPADERIVLGPDGADVTAGTDVTARTDVTAGTGTDR